MQKTLINIQFPNQLIEGRLRYVCDFLEQHPIVNSGLKFQLHKTPSHSKRVDYQIFIKKNSSNYLIPSQQILLKEKLLQRQPFMANEYMWKGKKYYSVEPKLQAEQPLIEGKQFGFDIFETIFFHISRYEEWRCPDSDKDQWDMMREELQFLVANSLEQQPVVDQLVIAFLEALGFIIPDQPTTCRISHDIDTIQKFNGHTGLLRRAAGLLKNGQGIFALRKLWTAYRDSRSGRQKDPYNVFDWMLKNGGHYQKVIYFLVGGDSRYDNPPNILGPEMQQIFALCKACQYEIGVHPSYNSWKNKMLISNELQRLSKVIDKPIVRSRQHYLRFSFQHTPRLLESLGIAEDSSLGFNERIGFRCGTGFPYRLYDFEKEQAFRLIEVPLVLMDSALLKQASFQPDRFWQLWNSFLTTNAENTFITFNFHNSRFFDAALYGIPLRAYYEKLIAQPFS